MERAEVRQANPDSEIIVFPYAVDAAGDPVLGWRMLPEILVTFARPEESRAFVKRLRGVAAIRWGGRAGIAGALGETRVAVMHTGIGPQAAGAFADTILAEKRPWLWVSAGFAGALDPRLGSGDVLIEELPDPTNPRRLISRPTPAETVAEKSALLAATGARAVDMETETIAAQGVPVLSVRAISDTAEEPLPVPFAVWFDMQRQRPRPAALIAFLMRHPRAISPFGRFVLRLPKVAAALAGGIEGAVTSLRNH